MKWLRGLIGLLLGALVLGLAVHVLLPALQGGAAWRAFLDETVVQRHTVIGLALFAIIGVVAFALTGLSVAPRAKYLAYETQYGNISISLKALRDFLGHLKNEFPAILSLAPDVQALDGRLAVVLEIRVRAGTPIPEVSRMLQERARLLIQDKIGIGDIQDIEVKVEEIVKDKDKEVHEINSHPPPAGEVPG
jgi:hypothetical protein